MHDTVHPQKRAASAGAWRAVLAAALALLSCVVAAEDTALDERLREQVLYVPVDAGAERVLLIATAYRPPGDGPFPLVVLNHGSPGNRVAREAMGRYRHLDRITEFVKRGFAVIVPMRRGYGATGGEWAERFGSCVKPDYYRAGLEAQKDLLAVLAAAAKLPFVDAERIVLVGQSAGGIAVIAAASANPQGVVAVVNLSGGRGGRPRSHPGEPCVPEKMSAAIARLSATIRVPVLWHYAENDRFFGPHHVRAWFKAFRDAGGEGELVMQPPFGQDGHRMFASPAGLPIWTREFDRFLATVGFETAGR